VHNYAAKARSIQHLNLQCAKKSPGKASAENHLGGVGEPGRSAGGDDGRSPRATRMNWTANRPAKIRPSMPKKKRLRSFTEPPSWELAIRYLCRFRCVPRRPALFNRADVHWGGYSGSFGRTQRAPTALGWAGGRRPGRVEWGFRFPAGRCPKIERKSPSFDSALESYILFNRRSNIRERFAIN